MMYSPNAAATRNYQSSLAEHHVDNADGYELVRLLLTHLIVRLGMARHCIINKQVGLKGEHLCRAVDIVNTLQVSLDHNHNADLADNLYRLYDYINNRLLTANLKNDVSIIDEVDSLARQVKSAWDEIGAERAESQDE